jgi:hypothetical protein
MSTTPTTIRHFNQRLFALVCQAVATATECGDTDAADKLCEIVDGWERDFPEEVGAHHRAMAAFVEANS